MDGGNDLVSLAKLAGGQDPGDGLRAVTTLRRELARLEADHVRAAVRAGWSWSEVGRELGITRQAAFKRHRRATAPPAAAPDRKVVVTGEARQAVRLAREEASGLDEAAVGTEHLLLGVLRVGEGPAVDALRESGVSLASARQVVAPTLEVPIHEARAAAERGVVAGPGPRSDPSGGEGRDDTPAISPLARSVLEQSLEEALERHEGYLNVEHVLLALLRDETGGAARTLERLGVPVQAVRTRLEAILE
jgi:ATP-dependent Clp protease ATP-binding subunit ClpA